MSKFFSFKLYREGLKKSRVVGITLSAVITALTALIPLVQILTPTYYDEGYKPATEIIAPDLFAIPLVLLLFLAPLLTFSLFNFLNKRNESDFYHAIPFTRPCVYFSFLAAVLTWLVLTLAASLALTTVLWCFVPYTAFAASTPLLLFGAYFLATLLLTGFTLLAMTLTGTTMSNLLIFALLFAFVRVSGALFVFALEEQFSLMVVSLTPGRFLLPEYSMPLGILMSLVGMGSDVFSNTSLWIYTAVISILLILAGAVVYTKRRSETAGKSAPNPILQHVYRCAVTLPMAFLTSYLIMDQGWDPAMIIVFVVLTLILYYLYEILTTKRLKSCLKASLFLPVLVAGGLLFCGSVALTSHIAASYAPNADQLESVSVYNESNVYYGDHTYQSLKTQEVEIKDPDALRFVAEKLAEMKQTVAEHGVHAYRNPHSLNHGKPLDYEESVSYASPITLKITEKSGSVCGRIFYLTTEDYNRLMTLFTNTKEYEDAFIALPSQDEILGSCFLNAYDNNDSTRQVWNTFVSEYNALSRDEKVEYMSSLPEYSETSLRVWGNVGTESFYNEYRLDPALFPETCAMAVDAANREVETDFQNMRKFYKDKPTDNAPFYLVAENGYSHTNKVSSEDFLEALEFAESRPAPQPDDATLFFLNFDYVNGYFQRYYLLSEADYQSLCEQLGLSIDTTIKDSAVIVD